MGLDMYARVVKKEVLKDAQVDFNKLLFNEKTGDSRVDTLQIAYWRKHHDLHGWMESLYYRKGGVSDSFNCVPVRLTIEDLNQLESDIKNRMLPPTTGFFFGDNLPDDDSDNEDLVFIEKARQYIHDGMAVYYTSWW